MKERRLYQSYASNPSVDGAGVHLRRLFWRKDTMDMDPFLMLDLFDSKNPSDYVAGFPTHPHRGIETFTYLIEGEIHHKDSLGNAGVINSGEYQWMNAGSGILHSEMPKEVPHMQGFQLWINLPKAEKMSTPGYLEGNAENIQEIKEAGYTLRLLSGSFGGKSKTDLPGKTHVEIYDIELEPESTLVVPTDVTHQVFVATMSGEVSAGNKALEEKSGSIFMDGDQITFSTGKNPARFFLFAGKPLNEPIAWGGPIVMNTKEELEIANRELREGTFIKHEIKI